MPRVTRAEPVEVATFTVHHPQDPVAQDLDRSSPLPEPHPSPALSERLQTLLLSTTDVTGFLHQLAVLSTQVVAMRDDLAVQRSYRYPTGKQIPVPVNVIGWRNDEVVAPAVALDGWSELGEVTTTLLDGEHFDWLQCPESLQIHLTDLLAGWVKGDGR